MRVASRRLRAVLEMFAPCFPRGPFRGVLRDVKQIADALGERRDPDVHLAAMEKLAAGTATDPAGGRAPGRPPARAPGGGQRGARPAARGERAARPPARAGAAASPEHDPRRSSACSACRWPPAREGPRSPGPRARRDARRQRRADRRHPPGRALRIHAAGGGPGRSQRASRHADRRQAPPLRSGDHASVLRRVRARGGRLAKDLQDLLGEIHDCDVQVPEVPRC